MLRELGGGYVLSSHPDAEPAARRLLARPRTPPLTPAQAETLAIIAYLQPVSRPEIARIRGVNAESAASTLLERGIVEEAGRSQFGAVLYRTTDLFLRLFGLASMDDLPEIGEFDPSPELEEELRERLLQGRRGPGEHLRAPDQAPVSCAPPTARTRRRCRGRASAGRSRSRRGARARNGRRRSPSGSSPGTPSRSGCTG